MPHAIRITGVTNMAPSADIWPHSSDLSVIKPAMTTGIVSALNEVRITANRNSFHARITENSVVATRPGPDRGRAILTKRCRKLHPSTTAAASTSRGILSKKPSINQTTNGRLKLVYVKTSATCVS